MDVTIFDLPKDVIRYLFCNFLSLGALKAFLCVSKSFYWIAKPLLKVQTVPFYSKALKLQFTCPFCKHVDKPQVITCYDTVHLFHVTCEDGHITPCHISHFKDHKECPRENCKAQIAFAGKSSLEKRVKK